MNSESFSCEFQLLSCWTVVCLLHGPEIYVIAYVMSFHCCLNNCVHRCREWAWVHYGICELGLFVLSHKSFATLDKYPTTHHLLTEMYIRLCIYIKSGALWDMGLVHCEICATILIDAISRHTTLWYTESNSLLYDRPCMLYKLQATVSPRL